MSIDIIHVSRRGSLYRRLQGNIFRVIENCLLIDFNLALSVAKIYGFKIARNQDNGNRY